MPVVLIVADSVTVGALVGELAVASSFPVLPLPLGVPSSPHAANEKTSPTQANEYGAERNMSGNVLHGDSRR
jgi:hypothetical protein